MLKNRIVSIASMLLLTTGVYAQGDYVTRARNYVAQYRDMAIAEQKRSGVPAAITLAQGIHETSAGNSELAVNANNHFGIKCKKSWTGEKYTYTDDAPDECFRKYSSPIESYKDHSDYLASQPRYASLFKLSPTDYFSWAVGLKRAGYATNPKYAQVLIKLIEDFKLQEYTYAALDNRLQDKMVAEVVPAEDVEPQEVAKPRQKQEPWAKQSGNIKIAELAPEVAAVVIDQPGSFPPYGQLVKVNGLKAVYAKKGDMPLEHAITHNVRYERLLEINEIADRPLQQDMYIYLERKRFKGLKPAHTVKAGETLANVAQYEGMQLKYLRSLNHLLDGEEPAEGEVLHLQEHAIAKPRLKGAGVAKATVAQVSSKVEAVVEPQQETSEVAAEVDNTIPTTHSKVERVAQSQPEPQFVATGHTPAVGPDIQFAAVNGEVAEQAKEFGPVPAPEVVNANEPIVSSEPAGILPPAPGDAPDEPREEGPVTVTPPINIANEKAVEEEIAKEKTAKPQQQDEPDDELAALKAKFDKVVYAPKKEVAVTPVTEPKVEEPVVSATPAKETIIPVAGGARFCVVKKGDTAFGIAKRYNITVKELMDWNDLSFEGIKVGQKLRVKP